MCNFFLLSGIVFLVVMSFVFVVRVFGSLLCMSWSVVVLGVNR